MWKDSRSVANPSRVRIRTVPGGKVRQRYEMPRAVSDEIIRQRYLYEELIGRSIKKKKPKKRREYTREASTMLGVSIRVRIYRKLCEEADRKGMTRSRLLEEILEQRYLHEGMIG